MSKGRQDGVVLMLQQSYPSKISALLRDESLFRDGLLCDGRLCFVMDCADIVKLTKTLNALSL